MGPRRPSPGFTLVEVLVTLVVTAILLSMVGSILVSALTTQRKVEATLLRERVGSAILDLIARDVQAVYAYDLKGVFVGTDERSSGGEADRFEFVTTRDPSVREASDAEAEAEAARRRAAAFSTGETLEDQTILREPPRLTRVGYLTRDSSGHPGLLTLFRSEVRFVPPPPQPAGAAGMAAAAQPAASTAASSESARFMEVYDRVKNFSVRYLFEDLDQNVREWRDSWDDPERIPAAIEIALEIVPDPALERGEGEDRPRKIYRTIVAIEVSQPKVQQQAGVAAPVAGQ